MNNTLANAMSVSVTGLPSSVLSDAEFSAHIKREEERISSYMALMGEAQPVSSLMKKDAPTFTWKVDCLERMRIVNLVGARGAHPKADINCTPLQSILIKHVLGR